MESARPPDAGAPIPKDSWGLPLGLNLRVVSWALDMVPNLLERVLMYVPLVCIGYVRAV